MVKLSKSDIAAVVCLYTTPGPEGLWRSANTIGDQFGVSNVCILYHLRQEGVPVRACAETQKGHTYRPIIDKPPPGEQPPLCGCGCKEPVKWDLRHWHKYVKGHYRPHQPYHDKAWLVTEYVIKERSGLDIAAECGVCFGTIYKFLRKFNLERRTTGESLCASGAMRGENNPAWKGGVADWPYSHDWKIVTNEIRDRDKQTCQLCGEQRQCQDGNLHVHHIDEDKLNNHPHNLISLCSLCHHSLHGDLSIRPKLVRIARHNSL